MKIDELNTKDGGTDNPCALISHYLLHEKEGGTLVTFLQDFEFDSRDEIEKKIREFLRVVYADPYMRKKHLDEQNPIAAALFCRCRRIIEDQSRFDKYPNVTSGEIWHGGFSRKRLQERTAAMFAAEPDAAKYMEACEQLKRVYGLTDTDIEKLHFFVEQVKAAEKFPDSLRRMLYIWGKEKKTGKTTSATMLVSLLNGDDDQTHIARYSTTLSNEMQIKAFAVPKVAECNVCLMDECFYADMGKTYADFKRFMTSSGGRARLPFGQEFEWVGFPNYIATSNEPLSVFIKDWGDRRYLSINFEQKPKVQLDFPEIKELWRAFVLNSQRTKDWQEWANDIAPKAEETGERQQIADEYQNELCKSYMLKRITDMPKPASRFCADNKVTIKTFVDLFSETIGNVEAHKRKKEIEAAVIAVFGERYSTSNYWLLTDMQEKANALLGSMWRHTSETDEQATAEPEPAAVEDDENDDLPF